MDDVEERRGGAKRNILGSILITLRFSLGRVSEMERKEENCDGGEKIRQRRRIKSKDINDSVP
ncbi:hypothetical protein PRIPAC_97598 [Pristionchus pacificus]|uniref:Uncharacterized protein n=1 Tax=Pristionchus pacificus TaxID=54126 RepID=A0A2A6D0N4_PRIPA|nr:hypothetical protein PRIPAC_97598 [Pristionchus pacificus]|eukprot:PDM83949.1 hypothetical protein PRIPAC_34141 [Pristionchus pacificus]